MKKSITILALLLYLSFSTNTEAQMDPFLGEISMFGGNFAPRGWAECNGQLLPISDYNALFSILGTMYGGDGRTTFGLPDLRGRVPMHVGNGPGLTNRPQGQKSGSETNTLTISQMPTHSHPINAVVEDGNQSVPTDNVPAGTKVLDKEYSNETPNTQMGETMIGNQGGGQPVNNVQPYITVRFIIALQGAYPSRS